MKKIAASTTCRTVIITGLCLSLVNYLPLRVSAAAAYAAIDLKSESQYRSEASRYDGAIRTIAGIATMKLETADELKSAVAILERERPNLKFRLSKLVATAISDSTFSAGVKRRMPDKQAVEKLLRELSADPNSVLKLDGAESVRSRLQRSGEADAATLRRVAEKLKDAAEKIKRSNQGRWAPDSGATDKPKAVRVSFTAEKLTNAAPEPLVRPFVIPLIVLSLVISAYVIGYTIGGASLVLGLFNNVFTEKGQDEVAECQKRADEVYSRCEANALNLNIIFRPAAIALCYAVWLEAVAICLVLA